MTSTAFVKGFTALLVAGLLAGMVQLSWLASERDAAPTTSVFTEALEPEIPIASEVDAGGPAEISALTF